MKWEMFLDCSYYDMYAVRPVGDKDFNSSRLFHFSLKSEAERLLRYLNGKQEADEQHQELVAAIKNAVAFTTHATRSRYAVPAEIDNALEHLLETYKLMYGEEYDVIIGPRGSLSKPEFVEQHRKELLEQFPNLGVKHD